MNKRRQPLRKCKRSGLASVKDVLTVEEEIRNPLQIPEMLQLIFSFCDKNSLSACRLVSKHWYDVSQSAWTLHNNVFLDSETSLFGFSDFLSHSNVNPEIFPNFRFLRFPIAPRNSIFWRISGSHVKRLEFAHFEFPSMAVFRQFVYQECPNIQLLALFDVKLPADLWGVAKDVTKRGKLFPKNYNLKIFEYYNLTQTNTILWSELFNQFPAMQRFRYRELHPDVTATPAVFRALADIRGRDAELLKLNDIDVIITPLDSILPVPFNILQDPQLALKNITVAVRAVRDAPKLKTMLTLHQATLKFLDVHNTWDEGVNPNDCFPATTHDGVPWLLENLQGIKINFRMFTTLAFLKFMPNLRTLEICNSSDTVPLMRATFFDECPERQLNLCTSLEFCLRLKAQQLLKLTTFLPNVTRLQMPLNNETFAVVCEHWTSLTCLDICRPCKVYDAGLTGLDARDIEAINNAERNSTETRPATAARANISNLKHLKAVSFNGTNRGSRFRNLFSIAAIEFGFRQAPRLEKVTVSDYEVDENIWQQAHPNVQFVVQSAERVI